MEFDLLENYASGKCCDEVVKAFYNGGAVYHRVMSPEEPSDVTSLDTQQIAAMHPQVVFHKIINQLFFDVFGSLFHVDGVDKLDGGRSFFVFELATKK